MQDINDLRGTMFSDEFVKLWDDLKANLILKMDLCHSKQIYKAYCFLAFLTNYGKKVARCRTFLTRKQTLWLINPTATKISRTKKTGNRFAMAKCVRNIHGIMLFRLFTCTFIQSQTLSFQKRLCYLLH